jgi:hypothetical protein
LRIRVNFRENSPNSREFQYRIGFYRCGQILIGQFPSLAARVGTSTGTERPVLVPVPLPAGDQSQRAARGVLFPLSPLSPLSLCESEGWSSSSCSRTHSEILLQSAAGTGVWWGCVGVGALCSGVAQRCVVAAGCWLLTRTAPRRMCSRLVATAAEQCAGASR